MVTLNSAENVLKDVYLGVIADQINTKTNPLFSRIKRSTRNIVGREIRMVAPIGINGGIMAGTETSELPAGADTPYISFVAPLKNLYGKFEISDKALRCSSSDVNSFVNLLQDGMDSLLKASIFNLSRMIYGDGTGCISAITVDKDAVNVDNIGAFAPGMYIDIYNATDEIKHPKMLVTAVDKSAKTIKLTSTPSVTGIVTGDKIYMHGSKGNEIIGLKGIVQNENLYGASKSTFPVLNTKNYTSATEAFDEDYVQKIIDDLEMGGTAVNFINCSYELKRVYQRYMTLYKKNIEYTALEDGSKVITHFGTPIVPTSQMKADECYFLNTDDFAFYELGDWKWLEDEAGRVLKQNSNQASYSATLVKYTELLCQKPSGVAFCKGIPTTIPDSSAS